MKLFEREIRRMTLGRERRRLPARETAAAPKKPSPVPPEEHPSDGSAAARPDAGEEARRISDQLERDSRRYPHPL